MTWDERPDGVRVARVCAAEATAVGFSLPCAVDEHFVGLGEQFQQLDKRGRVIDGWLGASVNRGGSLGLDGGYKLWPVWYSSAGYAAVLETTLHWRIEFAVADPLCVVARVPGETAILVLLPGPPKEACRLLTERYGRPPLAPPWAYGVWKCAISGSEAVLAQAARLRELEMPASAIWFYDFYDAETNTGCGPDGTGTYPRGEYPDLRGLVKRLHELDFRVMTYTTPYFYEGTPAFEEADAAGALIKRRDGATAWLTCLNPLAGDVWNAYEEQGLHSSDRVAQADLSTETGRAFWQGRLRKALVELGVDGWMEDFGEGVPEDSIEADGTPQAAGHNRFPVLYHAASAEEVRRSKPDAVYFARGGYLGAQAQAPAFWPGDQTRDWTAASGLASVPAAGISLGLMGVAAWGSDIGGCMDYPSLPAGYGGGSEDRELWIRWCQLGAMSPVMRDHPGFHQGTPVDAWTDAETQDVWRRCAEWHLRLFPYLYSAAHEAATRSGLPVLRGLMLEFPDDPLCWVLGDQYLLGHALLCAPVLWRADRRRRLYLPAGTWYDSWTGDRHVGPGWVEVDAPLERWPVLQRGGTVVTRLAEAPQHLNDGRYTAGEFDLELAVAPDAEGVTRLFDRTEIVARGGEVEIRGGPSRRYTITGPAGAR